jgi:hypothetical protein
LRRETLLDLFEQQVGEIALLRGARPSAPERVKGVLDALQDRHVVARDAGVVGIGEPRRERRVLVDERAVFVVAEVVLFR